jgi:hypothetical protein
MTSATNAYDERDQRFSSPGPGEPEGETATRD